MGYWFECVDHLGNTYESEAEMARAHGVLPSTFNRRKLAGMPLRACLSKPQKATNKQYRHEGKVYKSLRAYCLARNVSYNAVYNRMNRNGVTADEAIALLIQKGNKHDDR